jgi:hypothetical protein
MLRQPFSVAVLLSVAGLVPFLLIALIILFDPLASQVAIEVLISYGAVVLSFIGAVHWGFALRDVAHPIGGEPLTPATLGYERQLLIFGVVPALMGWIALLAMIHFNAPGLSIFLLLAGFFIAIVAETIGKGRGIVASNYLALRWAVSIVVLITLLVVLFAVLSGMRIG